MTIVDLMNAGHSYSQAIALVRSGAPLANAAHQRAMSAAPLQEPPGLDQLVASLEKSGPERVKQWLKPRESAGRGASRQLFDGGILQGRGPDREAERAFLGITSTDTLALVNGAIRYLEHPGAGVTGVTDHTGAPLIYTVTHTVNNNTRTKQPGLRGWVV